MVEIKKWFYNPLSYLIYYATDNQKKIDIIQFLIGQGADVNQCVNVPHNFYGRRKLQKGPSPLMIAVSKNSKNIIDLLIKHGVDVTYRDYKGNNILSYFDYKKTDFEIINTLIREKEKQESKNSDKKDKKSNLLHYVSKSGNIKMIEYLNEIGKVSQYLNSQDSNGNTPLIIAAKNNHFEIVEYFVFKGAKIQMTNFLRRNVLFYACQNDNEKMIRYLVEKGIKINSENYKNGGGIIYDDRGMTPLMLVVFKGNLTMTKYLVENGANVNIINSYKQTSLGIAVGKKYMDIVKYLIAKEANINIGTGRDFHYFSQNPSPLSVAVQNNNIEMVDFLIENGANVNIFGNDRRTPLSVAFESKVNLEIVKLLLKKKANPNFKNPYNYSALGFAIVNKDLEGVKYLVENGADVNFKNPYPWDETIIDTAIKKGNLEIIKYLVKKGADINAKKYKKTPLELAKSLRKKEIVEYLKSKGAK